MKYYNVEVIVYTEEEYNRIINVIKDKYKYASATHDKDINEKTGELIGKHTHIQIYGEIQKSIKSWSKLLNVKENMIETIDFKKKAIQYLIHKNEKNKYHYDRSIIKSNFKINEYFEEKINETEQLKILLEYIRQKGVIKYKDLLEFSIENDIWTTYRRNYSIIKDYIIERNMLTRNNNM